MNHPAGAACAWIAYQSWQPAALSSAEFPTHYTKRLFSAGRIPDDVAFLNNLSLDLSTQDDLTFEQKDLLNLVLDTASGALADNKMDLDLIGDESVEEADPAAVEGLSAVSIMHGC